VGLLKDRGGGLELDEVVVEVAELYPEWRKRKRESYEIDFISDLL
jgi:hypothetical protein